MYYSFQLYTIIYFLLGILAIVLAGVIWTRRPTPGASFLSIFMLCAAYWVTVNGIYTGAMEFSTRIFWSKMEYAGILTSAIFWLYFVLDFTGSSWFKNKKHLIYIVIIPFITLMLVWTNEYHKLIWADISWVKGPFGPALEFSHGFWFWIHALYCYVLYLVGLVILIVAGLRNDFSSRIQIFGLLLGTLIPFSGNLLYIFDLNPVKGLDLNPLYFILSGLIFAITIIQFKFLDVIPIARNRFVEDLPDGVLVINKEDNITDINAVAERTLGLEKGVAIGKKLAIFCPKLDIIKTQLGTEGHTELYYDPFTGYLDITILPFMDNKNFGGDLIILRNITEQRAAEQVLRESELKYETLVEQSNNGVMILQDGVCKFANRTLSEISQFSNKELLSRPISSYVSEEDKDIVADWFNEKLKEKGVNKYYSLKLKRKDGDLRNVEISLGNINYEGRSALMISVRDVTEFLADQEKLEYLYKEEVKLRSNLQEEINKRSKYFQALVHELRTPLTSIMASGELLESVNNDTKQVVLIHRVRKASLLLEQRVSELIELARGETGVLKLYPTSLDLTALINEITSKKSTVVFNKGISLSLEINQPIPHVFGERIRLSYVLNNLLDNAIKFTSEGEIVIRVTMHSPRLVLVQIKDSGRGISQGEIASLFDPYYKKLSLSQDPDGLSIGLALSKIFVDLHKGNIWVESIPGKGSIFSFTVPVATDENEESYIKQN
jgi:PAS domain S-box-containing protein